MACKGSRLGSALPCPAGRSVPGRGGPERRWRPRPDGTGPNAEQTAVELGHIGATAEGSAADNHGH